MSNPSRNDLLTWGRTRLADAGREAPRRSAMWILVDVLECRRVDLHLAPDASVDDAVADRFRAMIERRARGEPLQHVLGHDEFYGLTLRVTPDVLIPRPETEEVVEHALSLLAPPRADADPPCVLDVGTGSGCIALAIADQRPDAAVYACDVSADALDVARDNGRRLDVDVTWFEADLFDDAFLDTAAEEGATVLDLLVANPPYIPTHEAASLPDVVRDYDPAVALFAGDDPLRFYRRLADVGRSLCRPGGRLVLETHAEYADGTGEVLREAGWTDVDVRTDLAGRPRIASGTCPATDGAQ